MTRRPVFKSLVVLSLLNLLNYLDRFVASGEKDLIKDHFAGLGQPVSDAASGWLMTAVILTYTLLAPVMGWLGDRFRRTRILTIAAIGWSVATMMAAASHTFGMLVITRGFVGIGEAAYSTLAPAVLADLVPRDRRARVMAVFYAAIPIGAALGYIIGGGVGQHWGWRAPFLIGGIPGLIMAWWMAKMPEPERGQSDAESSATVSAHPDRVGVRGYLRMLDGSRAWIYNTLGMACFTFVAGGLSDWMPTYFKRTFGWEQGRSSTAFGIAVAAAGFLGSLGGGWLADFWLKRNPRAYPLLSGWAMGAAALASVGMCLAETPERCLLFSFLAMTLMFLNTGPSNAVVVQVVPPAMRAGAMAANVFFIHSLGDIPSPVFLGMLSDLTGGKLGLALWVSPIGSALGAFFFFKGAGRPPAPAALPGPAPTPPPPGHAGAA